MTDDSTNRTPAKSADTKMLKLPRSRTHDVQDARPLLQAICLGIFLAAVLTAAAALADPNTELKELFKTSGIGGTIPVSTQMDK